MVHKISEHIITYAISNGLLDADKSEEYIYGLELSLLVLLNDLTVCIIGAVMGMFWESVVFLFLYTLLRRYIGGFHFSSQLLCYLSMCVMCPIVLLIVKCSGENILICSAVTAIATSILWIAAPIPSPEKSIDNKERNMYERISKILIMIMVISYILLCIFQLLYWAKVVTVCVSAVTVFAVIAKIKGY